jgi:hypothetical protein
VGRASASTTAKEAAASNAAGRASASTHFVHRPQKPSRSLSLSLALPVFIFI